MYVTVAILLALQCTLCIAIRVPIAWNDEKSEVNKNKQFAFEQFEPQNSASSNHKPIPTEYFQYTAQKPKFVVDIAKFHGVQSSEDHYKAYPIKPHTGVSKPELGKHHILDKEKKIFRPYQEYVKKNEAIRVISPSSTSYEVFHPYKLEEPALKELYQDPIMEKIRSDLENNKIRLEKQEDKASQSHITDDEYFRSPEEVNRKKIPHKNMPALYEIHRAQRRPIYYRPPSVHNQREQVLNQKLKHPWHQNHVKVKPEHYRPVKNHLQRLRQQHALKYDDERNEYPQLPLPEKHSEPSEGYDIYEKGKAKFVQLRNNVDESLNEAIQKNKPTEHQKLELNDDDYDEDDEDSHTHDDEDDFVPVKNYAQVRKTETTKHLPKEAAYHDADTLEEIQNAPRLREAIKSTKAQTVYSEEGYEDSAYDHAGEQKHASDHEEHKGFLKEKELSEGKYKTPTLNNNYEDREGAEYHDQVLDGKEWEDIKQNTDKEKQLEDYSEKEQENSEESDTYVHKSKSDENLDREPEDEVNEFRDEQIKRIKREPSKDNIANIVNLSHLPENVISKNAFNENKTQINSLKIGIHDTNVTEKNTFIVTTLKTPQKKEYIIDKYPYYNNEFTGLNKDSPLRYAENLKFIPKKSEGGTEFYDSRAEYYCPDVDDNVDPIPEKLKKGGHPDEDEDGQHDNDAENSTKKIDKNNSDVLEKTPRLKGLGDKIDCFKAKYFGKNPLDSPFFNEEIISNPEPVTIPSIDVYRLKQAKQQSARKLKLIGERSLHEDPNVKVKISENPFIGPFPLKQNKEKPYIKLNSENTLFKPKTTTNQSIVLEDTLDSQAYAKRNESKINKKILLKEGVKTVNTLRRKRAAPFVYEPYKIIRDSQIQDSKKTTTTNNISPLIKQLQSSRVVDKVTNSGKDPIVKRNARFYKDIGKNEREKNNESKGSQPLYDASFVDVNIDQRRGEPRYELRHLNHKSEYSPVENKKFMTVDDYKLHTNTNQEEDKTHNQRKANRRRRTTTTRPNFNGSKFLPPDESHNNDSISSGMEVATKKPSISRSLESLESKEEYSKDNNDKENILKTLSTTAKTTSKRKAIDVSTTSKPVMENDLSSKGIPKLHLTTRFRNSFQTDTPDLSKHTEIPSRAYDEEIRKPKYREKKKKISKSTLVTDTNSYGEDDDEDLSKEKEVDSLIGVQHDIKEYLPTYEKEEDSKDSSSASHSESQEGDEDYGEENHNYKEDENDDDDDDEDDEDEDEDENEDEEIEEDEDDESEIKDLKSKVTTPEPTKRTLIRTTEIPLTTTQARSAKLEIEPVVVKKKLDIHKELPVNRSSPHRTEYKQDIKEVEIIKEIPSRIKKKPQKNIEALELYKDENLAKDINKLGGVEIFKEGLDLVNGPKHGGNYRIADSFIANNSPPTPAGIQNENSSKGDVEASQSETSKIIEIKGDPYSRRRSDIQRARNNRNRSAKLIELSDFTERPSSSRPMHGGNFKSIQDIRRRGGNKNSKLIELDDQPNRDDHSTNKHDSNTRTYGSRGGERHQMHGGNYRSAKLVKADDRAHTQTKNFSKKDSSSDGRQNSAALLNSFARAVSVLTTPAPYILDPSKRMYYYVES